MHFLLVNLLLFLQKMSDSESEVEETLATSRERRANAGSKMARLLDEEEEDDFYKTTYGGFTEVVH